MVRPRPLGHLRGHPTTVRKRHLPPLKGQYLPFLSYKPDKALWQSLHVDKHVRMILTNIQMWSKMLTQNVHIAL